MTPGPLAVRVGWAVAGVVLAGLYVAVGRRQRGRAERAWWAGGLVAAALVYVGFAVGRGAPALAVGFETAGVAVFGAFAALGVRGDRRWQGAGWLVHPVWDGLHAPGSLALAPEWYVWLCLAFDVVVGLWLLLAGAGRQRGAADGAAGSGGSGGSIAAGQVYCPDRGGRGTLSKEGATGGGGAS